MKPFHLGNLPVWFWLLLGPGAGHAAEPARRVFDVRRFGAKGDGGTLDTASLQRTIDACGKAGGGRVLLPQGRYLSATLRLRSGVEFHLAKGARLVGTPHREAYTGVEPEGGRSGPLGKRWLHALIVGEGLHDIAFTGPGTIDGSKVFDPQGEEKMRGPHAILLRHCRGVTLRDLTVHDASNYAFLFFSCEKVRVVNATFEGGWDGVHFRGSPRQWNRDVRIQGCRFFTGDDSIAGGYVEDALVEDCTINSSCNGVRLIGPARRLTFARCDFFGPGKFKHRTSERTTMLAGFCLQPSAWDRQPGPMEDVRASDITMRDVSCPFHIVIRSGNTADRLSFERIKATGVYRAAASVESWGERPFGKVVFRDVDIEYTGGGTKADADAPIRAPGVDARKLPAWGFYVRKVEDLTLERVRLTTRAPDARPVIRAEAVGTLRLDHVAYPPPPARRPPLVLMDVKKVQRNDSPKPPLPPRKRGAP